MAYKGACELNVHSFVRVA